MCIRDRFQIVELAAFDQRQLQLQQRVLAGVDIHGVNFRRTVQQIIQRVAAGAGEDHQRAVRIEPQQLAVDARVFPCLLYTSRCV